MLEGYKHLAQKPYHSHYLYEETVIDADVAKVWPHALNIGGWMSDHRLEAIDGVPGEVGHFERVFPRGLGETVPLPHHHYYGLAEVIPLKYISLEVLRERGGSYGNAVPGMAFDGIVLTDLGGRTKITFIQIDVALQAVEKTMNDDATRQRLHKYFDNLKGLVAANVR